MASLTRTVAYTVGGAAVAIGALLSLGVSWDTRGVAIGALLSLASNVYLAHRQDVRAARVMADQPAVMDPATEVSPGTVMVALVAAWGERPWWAPWRSCHTDHLTLGETTVYRPLVMPVLTGINAGGTFVVRDGAGVLMTVDDWADRVQPGTTVTTVVRTK